MNYARQASLAGTVFLVVFAAAAAPCPSGAPAAPAATQYSMTAQPDSPKVGQTMSVMLDPAVALPFTVCFDSDTIAPTKATVASTTNFDFPVPGDPKTGELTGIHTISLVGANMVYSTKIGKAVLTSVTSVPLGPANSIFRIRLNGGFDSIDKRANKIQLNGYPLDICWNGMTDSECTARNLVVRGDVLSSGQVIELTGMDPAEERSTRFIVINRGVTNEQTDSTASYQYWVTVGISALATLVLIGIVIGLVKKYLHPTSIENEDYVGRALFLDKETDTYSLSKFQFYVWTIVAVFAYVYLAISKNWFQHFFGLPPVPSGLPGIVGIAGGTAIGSQVVTNINGPKGAGQLKPSLADFVTTGDVVAAERVQFFVWTIIGAIGFLIVVARLDPRVLRDLPDVPSSMLAISGLSAFGYLGGKLARDPGPVVTESMVGTGPDPDAVPPTAGAPSTGGQAPAPIPQVAASMAAAKAQVALAKQRLQPIAASPSIQTVVTAANRSCDAAAAAIQAAEIGGEPATVSAQVQKSAADADAASREAAAAVTSVAPTTPKPDADNATTAASAAQQASAAAQSLSATLKSAPAPPTAAAAPPTAPVNFGRIELRGRTLSRDGNFRVSLSEESTPNDVDISFDQLQPSPKDDQHLKKPRIVERDSDSTDPNMAKRLLLVINVTILCGQCSSRQASIRSL
jgi:hypothetical protein